jgi:Family of unknown function (DUF6186)
MVLLDVCRLSGDSPMSSRELTILGRARRLGLAPLGDVMDAIRSSKAGRFALTLSWAWVGWHLLAR